MDRLCVFYENCGEWYGQGNPGVGGLHSLLRLVGVIYPELAMLPSTYADRMRGAGRGDQDCTERCGSGRMEFRQPDLLEDSGGGSGADPVQEQTAYDV